MSYQTGTSTGPKDLLDKLRLFLIADGWTVNKWDDDDTTYETWTGLDGDGKRLHVQKEASSGGPIMYFNFRAVIRGVVFSDYYSAPTKVGGKYYPEITGIGLYGSTGYDGGEAWDNQPGHPATTSGGCWGCCITELSTTAIPAYYFFSSGNTVVVCVERASGKYMWLAFGLLEKEGVYTGGQFFAGSVSTYWPSYQYLFGGADETLFMCRTTDDACAAVYFDADAIAGWRAAGDCGSDGSHALADTLHVPGVKPNGNGSYVYANTFLTIFQTRSPNFYNSLAPFAPIYFLGKRQDNNYSVLGIPNGIRIVNPQYYSPGEEEVLGSDTWMVFPGHDKDNDNDARLGFACKKVL
jgi:hypothetical protein